MKENEIRALFDQHGVELYRDDVWKVQGKPVIKHSALERLSAVLKLTWLPPVVIRSERDECVVLVTAIRPDKEVTEWSFGECLIVANNMGNYKVTGKQASYPYAMAEKRGKDRVIIKLAGLHGAFSEEEADDFAARNQDRRDDRRDERRDEKREVSRDDRRDATRDDPRDDRTPTASSNDNDPAPPTQPSEADRAVLDIAERIMQEVDEKETYQEIVNLIMSKDCKADLRELDKDTEEDVKAYARRRMLELGFVPPKKKQKEPADEDRVEV